MNRALIEEVYLDQNKDITLKPGTIKRDIDLEKAIKTEQIVVISGVRRSGKSTLLKQMMQYYESYSYFNFDDERLINFDIADFQELLLIIKKYNQSKVVFFDEIQNVVFWERFIRRIFDEGYKIFITGSNAKLLSSEFSTHLTGRYILIEMYPFSFKEILRFHKVDYTKMDSEVKSRILNLFDMYLEKGGFPDYIRYQDDEFLKRIYEDIIYKDLIVRYQIRNIKQFKKLAQYLFTNVASEISYNSLKNILGIRSANTVNEYIAFLEESWLLFELYKYDFSLKKQYISNKKIYNIDNGIRNTISFRFSEDRGKLLENLVFLELKRRQKEIWYYKTKNHREVDFLYYENRHFVLIQVAFDISNPQTLKRELKALDEASTELKEVKKFILTYDDESSIPDTAGITVKPVWKWLLNK